MGKSVHKILWVWGYCLVCGLDQLSYAQSQQGISPELSLREIRRNYVSSSAGSLKDLLFFWNEDLTDDLSRPWNDDFNVNAYHNELNNSWYGKCRNNNFYGYPIQEIKFAGILKLQQQCKPEFLYSWGNDKKIEELKSVAGHDEWGHGFLPSISDALSEKNIKVLYMGLTPASTFPYGNSMVQLKVRPGVSFVNIENSWYEDNWGGDCSKVPQNKRDNVIVYKYRAFEDSGHFGVYGVYLEYQACSPQVFESWSHDTSYNYDEIVKDYLWMMFGESWTSEHIAYQYLVAMEEPKNEKGYFHSQKIDGAHWSKESFFQTLKVQVDRINQNIGEVFYHNAVSNHYTYKKPLWFLNGVP